jgi:myo-inositol-1(or 4)-monophosphatase
VLLGAVGMNFDLGEATAYYQGCPALTLAYVAAGRLEGFVGKHLSPIDIKAGALMIQEAGGLVTDFSGEDNMVNRAEMVAGAPKLLKALLQSVRK